MFIGFGRGSTKNQADQPLKGWSAFAEKPLTVGAPARKVESVIETAPAMNGAPG
jgi:hypothetical protein